MKPNQDKSGGTWHHEELPFESEITQRLRSVKNPVERRTVARLLSDLTALPLEQTRAALETSALIAAISLRASIEFLRVVPDAAQVLEPAELRAWGELGRRLTMTDVENGVSFFIAGLGNFARVPSLARPFVFQVCARQMILSANTAAETFRNAPSLAEAVGDVALLRSIYEVAASIARRSAKHSAEFLNATPNVVLSFKTDQSFRGGLPPADSATKAGSSSPLDGQLIGEAIDLVKTFAEHAGGIAADAWAALPVAFDR